jgi:hypothetical protein
VTFSSKTAIYVHHIIEKNRASLALVKTLNEPSIKSNYSRLPNHHFCPPLRQNLPLGLAEKSPLNYKSSS